VKKCLLIANSDLCPDKKSVFENITLLLMPVQRRVTDISNNCNIQLNEKAEEIKYYSLSIDAGTDHADTVLLLIVNCGTDINFTGTEELAGLYFMKGRTTGKQIADEVTKCVTEKLTLAFDNSVSICTDGAPALRAKNIGAVALVEKYAG
jgi:hypothetical protein